MTVAEFDGATYEADRDRPRLHSQLDRVRHLMLDGEWRTLEEIAERTAPGSIAAISARLRDLRKEKFGGYVVEHEYVKRGVWRYRVLPPPPPEQARLFGV